MKDRIESSEDIVLDAGELLGLSQIAKVSRGSAVLRKISETGPSAPEALGRVLSKIGEPPPASTDTVARVLSKIGGEID